MLFKISVCVCLNIIVFELWTIIKLLKNTQRIKYIDKLQDYAAYRRRENTRA